MNTIPQKFCPQCKTKLIRPEDICCRKCARKIKDITNEAVDELIQYVDSSSMANLPLSSNSMTHLMSKYGLTPQDYHAMLSAQAGQCAICRKPPNRGELLVVDHCHYSGVVRELLCNKCNVLLGFANDSTELLQKSIEYLKKHTT